MGLRDLVRMSHTRRIPPSDILSVGSAPPTQHVDRWGRSSKRETHVSSARGYCCLHSRNLGWCGDHCRGWSCNGQPGAEDREFGVRVQLANSATNANPDANSETNSDADPKTKSNANPNSDADSNTDSDPNSNTDSNPNTTSGSVMWGRQPGQARWWAVHLHVHR
jgi:hypothetical protein